jgi:hypothetical protein
MLQKENLATLKKSQKDRVFIFERNGNHAKPDMHTLENV